MRKRQQGDCRNARNTKRGIEQKQMHGRTVLIVASISIPQEHPSTHTETVGSVNVNGSETSGKQPKSRRLRHGSEVKMSGSRCLTANLLCSAFAHSKQTKMLSVSSVESKPACMCRFPFPGQQARLDFSD